MATFSHIPSPFPPISPMRPQGSALPLLGRSSPRHDRQQMVGDSAAIKRLRLQIRRIGPHFRTVLITGEPGSGKETAARALHHQRLDATGPFVAATSGNRIASLIKIARGGSLFFKAIDAMPLRTQDELLEILRRNEWAQDGLAAPQRHGTRIIASSTRDLKGLSAAGRFRHELYQRIAMVQIAVPPLRERIDDLSALAARFLEGSAPQNCAKLLTPEALAALHAHNWPGNVRELEEVLERALATSEDVLIHPWDLVFSPPAAPGTSPAESTRLQEVVDRHVLRVLRDCDGNKLRAAELLGISRSTLYRMLDTCAPALE